MPFNLESGQLLVERSFFFCACLQVKVTGSTTGMMEVYGYEQIAYSRSFSVTALIHINILYNMNARVLKNSKHFQLKIIISRLFFHPSLGEPQERSCPRVQKRIQCVCLYVEHMCV